MSVVEHSGNFEPRGRNRIPHAYYRCANNLEIQDQIDYFTESFQEVRTASYPKNLRGPYYDQTAQILNAEGEILKKLHPSLKPEHLMPVSYMPDNAYIELNDMDLPRELQWQMGQIMETRLINLRALGAKQAELPAAIDLGAEVLDTPPYLFQGDGKAFQASKGCFNACFRMVFSGITGEFPHERAIESALSSVYGNGIVEDDVYLRIFETTSFKELFPDTDVQVLTLTGADLDTIAKITQKVKIKRPDSKVFCIVSLQTELGPRESIWHTNVLLGATQDTITTHDPSYGHTGQANRTLRTREFHERWAVAFNRAHLIVAA